MHHRPVLLQLCASLTNCYPEKLVTVKNLALMSTNFFISSKEIIMKGKSVSSLTLKQHVNEWSCANCHGGLELLMKYQKVFAAEPCGHVKTGQGACCSLLQ